MATVRHQLDILLGIRVDFRNLLVEPFNQLGHNPVYQPCCQVGPYPTNPGQSESGWPLKLPVIDWADTSIAVIQCYDFLTVTQQECIELNTIENYYTQHSNKVVVVHWEYQLDSIYTGPLNLVYFPCHTFQFIKSVVAIKDKWADILERPRSTIWQSLNGRISDHRCNTAHLLKHLNNGKLSLGNEIPLPIWPYSTYRGTENEDNWIRLLPIYSDCDINVVTETIYNNPFGIISEKTLMAFFALQVPILIGYQGIVDHCEKLGFDMFRDIVDTSYDSMSNQDRVTAAIEKNKFLLTNGIDRNKLLPRLKANQSWLMHAWPNHLIKDYHSKINDIHSRLTKSVDHHTM